MEKAECWEPRNPKNNFIKILNVDDAEYEDKFVKDKIPKFVLHVLETENEKRREKLGLSSQLTSEEKMLLTHLLLRYP